MRFNDKVDFVLNEVFEKDPLKLKGLGIEPVVRDGDYEYIFRDPKLGDKSPYYKVSIGQDPPRMSQLFRAILKEYPGSVGMGLTWGDDPSVIENFEKTGLKNEVFVYGVMINCLIDYVDRHGDAPAFLNFSGYTEDMNVVYDRFLKKFLAEPGLHKYAYIPYREDYYISKPVYDSIVAGESDMTYDLVQKVKENVVKKSYDKDRQLKLIGLQKSIKRIIKRVLQCDDETADNYTAMLVELDGVFGSLDSESNKSRLRSDFAVLKAAMLDKLKDRNAVADAMDEIGKILQDMKAVYSGDGESEED
jgi:hypothetical protein